ncbi:MAG TPA: S9 family peptidase, partial [Isosphaeraceae bacterium]|nr:S9 family peptidase [Isosphaeraceae bacterium]
EGKRSHIFVADVSTGTATDLTPELKVNTPPAPFGDSTDYAFSPDGQELAFTAEPEKDAAWSTNTDIWTVSLGSGALKNITKSNPAADQHPAYAPDGLALAYVCQKRAGFEADLWSLVLADRDGERIVDLSSQLDRPVISHAWAGNGRDLFAVIDDHGAEPIVAIDARGGTRPDGNRVLSHDWVRKVVATGANTAAQPTHDAKQVVFVRAETAHPSELFRANADGSDLTPLTRHNASLVADLDLAPAEAFQVEASDGASVGGFLVRPPGFDASKKYPVVFLIHGGPQGAWHDEWHGRWNTALFAAPGYVVVAVNPRGSTGYGQKFTDQISGDWTGKVYDDLMKGLDYALKKYSFLDSSRVAAAGGSYGGFMVDWIAGHSDRFKALISHAGVFDLPSMYATTEELWFPEWEFRGLPWKAPTLYDEQSPSHFAGSFHTPTLVIHGALDFRVPDAQGLGMFTVLQRQGVPSRLVYFPDEGHWIAKPDNRIVWWREVHAWLKKYLQD